jgi:hypothetical protein
MRFADRLQEAHHSLFVGRGGELATFVGAVEAVEPPFGIIHVWGPGGVGKTALLTEFAGTCRERDIPLCSLDFRRVDATPEGFRAAAGDFLREDGQRRVLLLDTFELAAGLDTWLRDELLPEAPSTLLVVIAGRDRPSAAWRTDPGWRTLAVEMPLENLPPADALLLLSRLGVPEEQRDAALAYTRGHPLALALAAEHVGLAPDAPFDFAAAPDVVGTLLRRFVEDVPGPDHRLSVEACALARNTTESLIAALVERPAAPELFAWLRSLSFMEEGPEGLFPHDLVRDVLAADLRWRHPERFADLHARARRYYTRQLQSAAAEEQERLIGEYGFLYRDNPVAGPLIAQLRERWQTAAARPGGAPRAGEWALLRSMVERHEGSEAARAAAYWFERQPEGVEVIRDDDGAPAGFLARVALERATDEEAARDPAVAAALTALRRVGALREGERALLFRFWMDRDAHQAVTAVQSVIFKRTVWHYLATPGLAFSVFPCATPHGWAPILGFAGMHRLPSADYETGGVRFEAFGHDWRLEPPETWLNALADRAPDSAEPPAEVAESAIVVLTREEFGEAVKEALKAYAAPAGLMTSPLLRSRLMGEQLPADEAGRIRALMELIDAEVSALERSERDAAAGRALRLTYLKPAPSQAIAAERLDLPFSTYRRYLGRAIERVTEALWAREIGVDVPARQDEGD